MSIVKNIELNKNIYSLNGEVLLTGEAIKEENKIILKIEGAIKTLVAPCFEEIIQSMLKTEKYIVLDLGGVSYVASAGLRVLLNMQQEVDNSNDLKVEIVNISPMVREVLETTGFINILTVID